MVSVAVKGVTIPHPVLGKYGASKVTLLPASSGTGLIACAQVRAVLEAAGVTFEDVVKTTVYLATMDDFAAMNEVYAEFFPAPPPARSTVQVAALPLGACVEIEVVAVVK